MENKHYELTYIISTAVPETEHNQIKESVAKNLEKNNAKITDQQDLGKKKFTYTINKVRHGFYQVIEFDATPEKINQINNDLKLNDQVLRFIIVIKPQLSEEDKIKQAKAQAAQTARQAESEKTNKEDEKKEDKKKASKVSLEDLDEKLDEILDSEDLVK